MLPFSPAGIISDSKETVGAETHFSIPPCAAIMESTIWRGDSAAWTGATDTASKKRHVINPRGLVFISPPLKTSTNKDQEGSQFQPQRGSKKVTCVRSDHLCHFCACAGRAAAATRRWLVQSTDLAPIFAIVSSKN